MSPPTKARIRDAVGVGLWLIVAVALLGAIILARDVFLLSFAALLVATLLRYPIDWLGRRMPRTAAVVITLVSLGSVVVAAAIVAIPALGDQLALLWKQVPAAAAQVERWFAHSVNAPELPGGQAPPDLAHGAHERLAQGLGALASKIFPAAISVAQLLSAVVFVFVLAAFLAADPHGYRVGLISLVPDGKRQVVGEALSRLDATLRRWMGGILVSMTIMGTLTAIGLYVAGISAWATLGLLTFFGTFVPYLGALASAVPGLAVALAESPRHFFYALAVYLGVHIVEGYWVEPLVMKRAVSLKPALLIFWQLAMTVLFGVFGTAVATPLLACIQVLVGYLYVERTLGERNS